MTRAELIKQSRYYNSQMNMSALEIYEEQEKTGIKSEFLSSELSKFRELTSTKSKTFFSKGNLSRMRKADLQDLVEAQQQFLKSPWADAESRAAIEEKSFQTFNRRYGFDRDMYHSFVKAMNSMPGLYDELKEASYITSGDVIDMIKEGISGDDIVKAMAKIADNYSPEEISKINDPSKFIREQALHLDDDDYMNSVYTELTQIQTFSF